MISTATNAYASATVGLPGPDALFWIARPATPEPRHTAAERKRPEFPAGSRSPELTG